MISWHPGGGERGEWIGRGVNEGIEASEKEQKIGVFEASEKTP